MRCDIIMPVWNELEATRECVDSLVKNTGYPHKLIIVDNGSGRETASYLTGLKAGASINAEIIRNDENLGFAKGVNQGIAASNAPYICVMNNDTIAAPGWLEEMMNVMAAHPEIGILNPSSNTSGQKGSDPATRNSRSGSDPFCQVRSDPFCNQVQELYRARGFCMLIRREVIEKIGLFDESYGRGYFEETDYSCRVQAAGFRIARAKGSYVYHKESLTFNRLADKEDLFRRNEKIFREKWGMRLNVGYILDKVISKERVNDIAVGVARSGHQISIFLKKGLEWPVAIDHFDIRKVDVGRVFFGFSALLKILKRKKKKKLDIILTDNPALGRFLRNMESLHGSDVIVHPDKERLIDLLKGKGSAS
jgi:GT2 family glycosyltransferase